MLKDVCDSLVTEEAMEFDDKVVFVESEIASLEIRAEIVDPPETAAFAAPEKTGGSRKRTPTTFAVGFDVRDELIVFFLGPSAFVRVVFLAARRPTHLLLMMMLLSGSCDDERN